MDFDFRRSGSWIGAGGLAVVLWVIIAVSMASHTKWYGVLVQLALLIPQIALVRRWARTRPTWCPWVPVVGVAAVFVVAVAGARWLW